MVERAQRGKDRRVLKKKPYPAHGHAQRKEKTCILKTTASGERRKALEGGKKVNEEQKRRSGPLERGPDRLINISKAWVRHEKSAPTERQNKKNPPISGRGGLGSVETQAKKN
jgi:hypothetical protein